MSDDAHWADDSFNATDKGKLAVFFHAEQVQNNFRTKNEQRPVFEEQVFITKLVPGDNHLKIDRKMRDEDKDEFPEAWARWINKSSTRVPGTPIEVWHALTDTQKAEFKFMNIFTVEQFANLPFGSGQKIMGFNELQAKARVFIDAGKDAELIGKIRAEADAKTAALEAKLAELTAMVESLTKPDGKELVSA